MFTVNDVSHGGCKYGIMSFSSSSQGSLSVELCDNLYFTNRKVGVFNDSMIRIVHRRKSDPGFPCFR